MKRALKLLTTFLLVLAMVFSNVSIPLFSGDSGYRVMAAGEEPVKVDLSFVIDSTGSMSPYILNVKNNIIEFAEYLEEQGISLRISVVEYRDITIDGVGSTKVHKVDYSPWHSNTAQMIDTLSRIIVGGGGDLPETVIDGLGYLVDGKTMLWSTGAYKFAVVLTDANYKVNNTHGIADLNEVAQKLLEKNINTSVISFPSYKDTYEPLIKSTGGIFADINSSNFSQVLIELANKVIDITKKKKKAIYVLPGYMGSRLYGNNGNGDEIWVEPDKITADITSHFVPFGEKSKFIQNSDGTGIAVDVNIDKDKYGAQDTYKKLIDRLEEEFGGEDGKYDIVFFPYNWLGDLNVSVDRLENHIQSNGYENVIFVTHSTGGLLASAYIASSDENKRKVEKAVLIAAPLFGTYSALEPVELGKTSSLDDMLAENGVKNYLGVVYKLVYQWVKDVTKNSPTTYQLFPSSEYLQLMPQIYAKDVPNPVVNMDDYYKILNGSSNINPNLTNGNNRSHKYFRDTVLGGDVINAWTSKVVEAMQEVDTVLVGSGYGNMTPAIAVYEVKSNGKSSLKDIIYKMDGDGTVLKPSAFATKKKDQYILNYKDFENVSHTGLVFDESVLDYVCNHIKGTKRTMMRAFSAFSDKLGMSEFIKLNIESDKNVNITIEDESGEIVAYIKEVTETITFNGIEYPLTTMVEDGFDGEKFIHTPLSLADEGINSIIYMPNYGYKVRFTYGDQADEEVSLVCEVSTLDYDGYKTASATYIKDTTLDDGEILVLDATKEKVTEENVGNLAEEEVPVEIHNADWQLEESLNLSRIGETKQISILGSDADSVASKLSWSSSNTDVVTVSETGEVTAVGHGTAIIAATDGYKVSVCNVTVVLETTTISFDDVNIVVGERKLIRPIFDSDSVTERDITYEYNESAGIISIDEHGVILGLKEGSIVVKGIAPGGASDTFTVTVGSKETVAVNSVSIKESEVTVQVNGKVKVKAVIEPSDATDKSVTWHIDDDTVASIESDGLTCTIKGLQIGTTDLTVVTNDGGYNAKVKVNVVEKVTPTPKPTSKKSEGSSSGKVVKVTPEYTPTPSNTATPTFTPTPSPTPTPEIIDEDENIPAVGVGEHKSYIKGYTDNTFKPEKNITRAEAAVIFANLLEEGKNTGLESGISYLDIDKNHWAAGAIGLVSEKGLFKGYADGSFKPDQSITRAEFATVVYKFLQLTKGISLPEINADKFKFEDTKEHWANQFIEQLAVLGFVSGYSDGTFKPENNIKRAESVVLINRALKRGPLSEAPQVFSDVDKTHWAYYDIIEAAIDHKYTIDANGKEVLLTE